ncbi:hypothetical protein IHE33_07985 [Mycetohabitans endofungorum]|uniref:neuraminidase-like domain-containing protein n=1 Tax=Mycetohabitans endofungorum TaxID=417203 RepID=UPI0030CEA892
MSADHPILLQLDESRRDALVQFYLGQIAPEQGIAAGQLTTPEDLYQYLLLDNQVSAKVTTSWVAEAIVSLQQYIHGIYNGMEPGHATQAYDREDIDYWRHWQALYSVWGANQLLQSYPENYIDPTLRIKKTKIFKEFESSIAQARINSDRVRDAVLDYLRCFEEVSNLKVLSGYIDGAVIVMLITTLLDRKRPRRIAITGEKRACSSSRKIRGSIPPHGANGN